VKIIILSSLKGGVGKTAISIHLALELRKRHNVVFLDLDPQASATDFLLRDTDIDQLDRRGALQLLTEAADPRELIWETGFGIDCIPSTLHLHRAGIEMAGDPGAMLRIAKEVRCLEYDYAIVDSPPGLSYEFRQAINMADIVLSPMTYDRWAVQGVGMLIDEVAKARKSGGSQRLLVVPSIVSGSEDEKLRQDMDGEVEFSRASILRKGVVKTALGRGRPLPSGSDSEEQFHRLSKELS
tara:strand:+ start:8818 stop:9537 length:720 start_codon:yes stop_codon:yes gene_type:complete